MKRLSKYFLRGLMAILPLALTVYVLYLFLAWTESVALWVLRPVIGSFYVPGLGLFFGVILILGVGVLVSSRRIGRVLAILELPLTNLPVVKSIYTSLKSFADYFAPTSSGSGQQVVSLRMPGHELEIIGLVTRRNFDDMPAGLLAGDRVAVYLPMGYMIGGYTVFVPSTWVTPLEMTVEEAMRSALIAFMAKTPKAG